MYQKNKKKPFVTFYDVAKADDRADVEDSLVTMWEHGMKGKLWRPMKSLNINLTAKIKTTHLLTREIKRRTGGKRGGKNFGYLFAKMMDVMAEDAENDKEMDVIFNGLKISILGWVDDVAAFALGTHQQLHILNEVNEFSIKTQNKMGKR